MSSASEEKVRTPVTSREQLVQWFRDGFTGKKDLKIGLEHEKIMFDSKTHAPANYETIKDFFSRLADKGWTKKYEGDNLVELKRNNCSWSLEPGGQVEIGDAPRSSVHEIVKALDAQLKEADAAAKDMGHDFLGVGFHPENTFKTMPRIPRTRYKVWEDYLKNKSDLIICTSTVQVNLGFESEEDMIKKLRVSLALQPIVSALFATSPFKEGQPTGFESYRNHTGQNAWDGRWGFMLPMAFDDDFSIEKFVDFALATPLLGVYREGKFISTGGKAHFQDLIDGKLEAIPGEKATLDDWANHLNTIWPEVRLRRFLEMRGADSGPPEMLKALPALWTGLLYDAEALDKAYALTKSWTTQDRDYLRTEAPKDGLKTKFHDTTVQEIAKQVLALSELGLRNRNIKNERGDDESIYLAPLTEIVKSGRTLATRMVEKFHTEWKRDVKHIYDEFNFRAKPTVLPKKPRPVPAVAANKNSKSGPKKSVVKKSAAKKAAVKKLNFKKVG